MLAAVQRERERIAVGVEMRQARCARAAASCSSAPAPAAASASSSPPRCRRPSAPTRRSCRRSWPAARTRSSRQGRRRGQLRGRRARDHPAASDQEGRRDRRLGQRHDAVRARRADPRAQGRRAHHLRDLRPGTELQTFVDLTIAPGVGAEVIAGSTRLKAGTATKLVLNMLTTGAMIRIGKTYGNLMVDVQTGSEKLKDRARPHRQHRHRPRIRRGRSAAQERTGT